MSPYYEELVAADYRIKYKHFHEAKFMYIFMHEWLVNEGWVTRTDSDFPERYYLHRFTQQAGQEVWFWWRLVKQTRSPFFEWRMNVDVHIILLKETEIMHDGKKIKAHWGEPEIGVVAKVVTDPKGEWAANPLMANLVDLFRGRIMKRDMEMQKLVLYREAYRFQEGIKNHFGLKTWLPEREDERFYRKADFSV